MRIWLIAVAAWTFSACEKTNAGVFASQSDDCSTVCSQKNQHYPECSTPTCRVGTVRTLNEKAGWTEVSYISSSQSLHVTSRASGPAWMIHDQQLTLTGGRTVEWTAQTASIYASGGQIFGIPDRVLLDRLSAEATRDSQK